MPIYEFYCQDCNTLFNFYSATIDTTARPLCPRCEKVRLERRPARFATLRHGGEGEGEEASPLDGLDEGRLEGVMESLMGEMEGAADEDDPKALARLLRRFGDASGLKLGGKMEEYMARLESGEDPDQLDQEMEDAFGDEESMTDFFELKRRTAAWRLARRRPEVDETLYFL